MSVFLGQEGQHVVLDQQRQYGKAYPVPYQHSEDNNKSGIVNRQLNKSFLKDLALMLDVLQGISILSEALQSRAENTVTAKKLLKRTISSFQQLKECLGCYVKQVEVVIETISFSQVNFVENRVYGSLLRDKLIQHILTMQDNLLNTQHTFNKKHQNYKFVLSDGS
jgi:hypothetical protein